MNKHTKFLHNLRVSGVNYLVILNQLIDSVYYNIFFRKFLDRT